jgi:transposase
MPECKAEIVECASALTARSVRCAGTSTCPETAVRDWVKQGEVDAGDRSRLASDEPEELAPLRREDRRLREDVDILNRATAFVAKETR